MKLPESTTDRFPALAAFEEDWEPVPKPVLIAWVVFYVVVLAGAIAGGGVARWIDLVFVPIHEGGHLLFGWFGSHWLMVAGGTLLQLFVPFALAVYFASRGQLPGACFCSFFFFEQLLPVGIYMADSRSQSLSYVTVGDPNNAEHDWYYLFSHAGVLDYDTAIGAFVRSVGWVGMFAVVGWLIWRAWPRLAQRRTGAVLPARTTAPGPGPAIARAPKVAPRTEFGQLGANLESAEKSPFWNWFHLEQTFEQNGVRRFQPNGPKFHSLCYLEATVLPNGGMQALTLGLQRKFIEGVDEPFARDLVKSFVNAVFPEQRSEEVERFVEEVSAQFGGARPVIVAEGVRRAPAGANPSGAYLVFIGQGKRCRMKSGAFELEEENVTEGRAEWLCLRVKPSSW